MRQTVHQHQVLHDYAQRCQARKVSPFSPVFGMLGTLVLAIVCACMIAVAFVGYFQ